MGFALALGVSSDVLAAMRSKKVTDLFRGYGYEENFYKLLKTLESVNAGLSDAELRASEEEHFWEKLKDDMYGADDMLDELINTSKVSRLLFLDFIRKFINLKNRLDSIFRDRSFYVNNRLAPIARDRSFYVNRFADKIETISFIDSASVIGRKAEKEAIVGILVSDSKEDVSVSVVTIVGIPGMGKTTLAQLVYNDDRIISEFELRFWVCVSDCSQRVSVKIVLDRILVMCSKKNIPVSEFTKENLVKQAGRIIKGKRFLLVLDDAWCQKKMFWDDLRDLLSEGDSGSRILVTTRSMSVANVILHNHIFELKALSKEDSWELFKSFAFSRDQQLDAELVEIAKQLTERCAGLPFTIKLIASKFCGQDRREWYSLQTVDFSELPEVKGLVSNLGNADESDGMHRSLLKREETCSYVKRERIIGREADQEAIVGMLLSHNEDVSFVTIVGMAGMGKTSLAQLVFNDDRIMCEFELRLWVCVNDDDPENFDIKSVLRKILENFLPTVDDEDQLHSLEWLSMEVNKLITGRKYLLVLDSVACEDCQLWVKFKRYFHNVGRGSRILITSRSMMVADAIEDTRIHEAKRLLQIGKEVTQRCSGVPLFIRVIGSALYSEDEGEWLKLKYTDLNELPYVKEDIMPILRLSFHQLNPILRRSIAFCSIFPKNYVIQKKVLISLWLAQGYLVPSHEAESMEEIGEQFFSTLLRKFFFQDIQWDDYGEVISFKMHDFLHHLAQQFAGAECLVLGDAIITHVRDCKIHHLSFSPRANSIDVEFNTSIFPSDTLRTIFNLREYSSCYYNDVGKIISSHRHLRLLDLHNMALRTLPDDSFDKVAQLRYLDLSDNDDLEMLPASITRLHNLQVLRLCGCKNLNELPEDLGNLINLRCMDIVGCDQLTCMPAVFDKLTCLESLTMFVVGDDRSKRVNKGQLTNLEAYRCANLRGDLLIKVGQCSPSNMRNVTERACTVKDAQLRALEITYADGSSEASNVHEALLERFEPNQALRRIMIQGFQGTKWPSWAVSMETNLPNLVRIKLSHFRSIQHLTVLSQLRHLKYLHLRKIWNVESLEMEAPFALPSTSTKAAIFFPSLEKLVLEWMPNLQGWWRDVKRIKTEAGGGFLLNGNNQLIEQLVLPSFPCLRDLSIHLCQSLTYFPPCPHVKSLELKGVNEEMAFCVKGGDPTMRLEKLIMHHNARVFDSVVAEFVVPGTVDINLKYFFEEKSLEIAREPFQRCASSLKHLSIDGFYKLGSLTGGGIENVTNLQSLTIKDCPELHLEEMEVEEEGMPWKYLQFLSSLTFDRIPKMVNLPNGLQYLTSMKSLDIRRCNCLKALGECLTNLTSLETLRIEDCYNLETLPEYLNSETSKLKLHIKNCPKLEST